MDHLLRTDPDVFMALKAEIERQTGQLEMIASENFASEAVMEAEGSAFMNKYAEGYPDHRYYGGCENMDTVERLARERLELLFGAEYSNVQPHSGSQANMAVYFAMLEPGDTILSMDLAHGGHLSHGAKVSFSGRLFNVVHYGVDRESETIDFEQVERLAQEHRPKMIVAGASAYPRTIDFNRFKMIADSVGAYLMVDMAHIAGLVASGNHPSPVGIADFVTSTTHKTLRGPRGGFILTSERYGRLIDSQVFPGIQGGPLMQVIAAKAVAFKEALAPEFKTYCHRVLANAQALARVLQEAGFRLVSGGTDNHLILVDLTNKGLTGAEAEEILEMAGITVNKNAIPFDPKPPKVTSGIRLGTPALTTRGMGVEEMETIAGFMVDLLTHPGDEEIIKRVRLEVKRLCDRFPLYQERLQLYTRALEGRR